MVQESAPYLSTASLPLSQASSQIALRLLVLRRRLLAPENFVRNVRLYNLSVHYSSLAHQ